MRATYYSLDGGTKTRYGGPVAIAKSGVHELDYWSVDKAGNVERTSTVEVRVDVTAPVTKVALSGPVGEAGFYRDDVTVALDASDAQSGVAGSEIAVDGAPLAAYDAPIVVSLAGTHVVSFRSTDVTGRAEKTKTATFTIDRTAPTIGGATAVAPSAAQFSPNGDGLADTIDVSHALSERGADQAGRRAERRGHGRTNRDHPGRGRRSRLDHLGRPGRRRRLRPGRRLHADADAARPGAQRRTEPVGRRRGLRVVRRAQPTAGPVLPAGR